MENKIMNIFLSLFLGLLIYLVAKDNLSLTLGFMTTYILLGVRLK